MERIAYVLKSEDHAGRFARRASVLGADLLARVRGRASVYVASPLFDERLSDIGVVIAVARAELAEPEQLREQIASLCVCENIRYAALENIERTADECGGVRFFDGAEYSGAVRLRRALENGLVDKEALTGVLVDARTAVSDLLAVGERAGQISIYAPHTRALKAAGDLLYLRLGAVAQLSAKAADMKKAKVLVNLTDELSPLFNNFTQIFSPYLSNEPLAELCTEAYAGKLGTMRLFASFAEARLASEAKTLHAQ